MFWMRVRVCCSNVWGKAKGLPQCSGLGSGSAPMFGVRVRECSNVLDEGQGVLQCLGLGSGSAPMSGVRVRECSNIWS